MTYHNKKAFTLHEGFFYYFPILKNRIKGQLLFKQHQFLYL